MFCLARTDSSAKAQRGISFLLIDMRQPGVTVRPIITLAGDHEVNEVFLENVRVEAADLVGNEGEGWTIAKFLLENERGGSCFAPKLLADIAQLREDSMHESSGFDRPLAQDNLFSVQLARLELEAQALEITELRILEQLRLGQRPGPQSSIVKLVASDLRKQIDALAMNVFGYSGLQLETRRPLYGEGSPVPVYRKEAQVAAARYLNSQAWTIFGGSNEVQLSIIAKTVLVI
jgi:alkylation response protein AidB-like acyl-CoA dehydrogenase